MYCLEVFHLQLSHVLLIRESFNTSIFCGSLTHSWKTAVTSVFKCSVIQHSDRHELPSSEKYGWFVEFLWWHISKQHSCWGVRSGFFERQTQKKINCPYIFYSRGPPGNNPDPVDVCPRLVDNDCSCPAMDKLLSTSDNRGTSRTLSSLQNWVRICLCTRLRPMRRQGDSPMREVNLWRSE